MSSYFTREELLTLQSFEGKVLQGIQHVLWQNIKQTAGGYEALDWIVLDFTDNSQLTFTSDEENTGIFFEHAFQFEKKERETLKEFGGQVILIRRDMRDEPPWIDAIGKTLKWIGLEEESEGIFSREALRLDFGDWAVDIGMEEEGLKVDVGLE